MHLVFDRGRVREREKERRERELKMGLQFFPLSRSIGSLTNHVRSIIFFRYKKEKKKLRGSEK